METVNADFAVGNNTGSSGTVTMTDGSLLIGGDLQVGSNGYGAMTVSGGDLSMDGALTIDSGTGSGFFELAANRVLTQDGSDKGTENETWQTEEQTDDGSDRSTPDGPSTGSELANSDQAGCEVQKVAGQRQQAEDGERCPADVGESVRPGPQYHSGKNQQGPGNDRGNDADKPEDDQNNGQDPENRLHGLRR